VLDRIRNLPRHFRGRGDRQSRYEDTALPIGFGQTISQPYIVARMTEALLDGPPLKRLLEVGTGCGYQTAVLAPLVERIYSIERIAGLQNRARQRLKKLDVRNVRFKVGAGSIGWRTQAPFDGIIVAAAPLVVPEELIEQLAPNGRLLCPQVPRANSNCCESCAGSRV
jgi:protein-L-isoaspartate(D-aspartate) O-methyltransferase